MMTERTRVNNFIYNPNHIPVSCQRNNVLEVRVTKWERGTMIFHIAANLTVCFHVYICSKPHYIRFHICLCQALVCANLSFIQQIMSKILATLSVNVSFQYPMKTSTNILISWWSQETFWLMISWILKCKIWRKVVNNFIKHIIVTGNVHANTPCSSIYC